MSRLTEHTFVCRSCALGHAEPCSDFIETTQFGTVACFCPRCNPQDS